MDSVGPLVDSLPWASKHSIHNSSPILKLLTPRSLAVTVVAPSPSALSTQVPLLS